MDLIHGGDIVGYEAAYGKQPLDFSASLNPLGLPDAVAMAARNAVATAEPYPDPLCRRLTAALAERCGVPESCVFCGNGAADVIHRLVLAERPRVALIPVPAFAEYEQALWVAGCTPLFYPLAEANGFRLDDGILGRVTPGLDMLFLCQPNNPTGLLIEPELLSRIVERSRECGVTLALDECFLSLTGVRDRHSLVPILHDNPHVVVIDSFTKLYAMAGLRLGFALTGDAVLAGRLRRAGQPWAVSSPAQEAGLAALREDGYVARSIRVLAASRRVLLAGLEKCGCRCYGSAANYVFFFSGVPDLGERLAERGILVRDCANFRGLSRGYYRVAVRRDDENAQLLEALASVVNRINN